MKTFHILLTVSVLLIIGGFFVPPIGVIDGSVLSAVGLLLMFATIEKLPETIKSGRNIKLQKGDSSVEISGKPSAERSPF